MWPNNTSGQSNLRTHRCRRRIRQMAPRALPYGHVGATWQIWLNLGFLPPTLVHNPNGKSIGSAISAQLTAESPYTLQWATLSPKIAPSNGRIWTPSNTGFLGPFWAHIETASWSLQLFSHGWPPSVPILFNGPPPSPIIAHSHGGSNTWFLGPIWAHNPNGMTDRPRYSVGNNRIDASMYVIWSNNNNQRGSNVQIWPIEITMHKQ